MGHAFDRVVQENVFYIPILRTEFKDMQMEMYFLLYVNFIFYHRYIGYLSFKSNLKSGLIATGNISSYSK